MKPKLNLKLDVQKTVVISYFVHFVNKSQEMRNDRRNIQQSFYSTNESCFWLSEASLSCIWFQRRAWKMRLSACRTKQHQWQTINQLIMCNKKQLQRLINWWSDDLEAFEHIKLIFKRLLASEISHPTRDLTSS